MALANRLLACRLTSAAARYRDDLILSGVSP
jgi:hypothetical protein